MNCCVYQEQVGEAVAKEKEKKLQPYQTQEGISEIPVEEAKEVGRDKQAFSDEKVEEIKFKVEEVSKILPVEEVKPLEKMPPLILGEQEEIKFNPSITKVILRAGGGADYITTHSGISKKKHLRFEIYQTTSDYKTLADIVTRGTKVLSREIQTNPDRMFEITCQSTEYQQGNYYMVVTGSDDAKDGYKRIHFVRISPLSTERIEQREIHPAKPIIKEINK
ncbi:MAG: hypothetical protein QME42_08715 [bacterium]|nr:hypothetical protein [bacterium]